jgi:hypothetical protein
LFGVVGLSFHYGIAYLQNVDFISWWGPTYAFFLLDPAAAAPTGADPHLFGLVGACQAAWTLAPVRTALALAYVFAHFVAMLTLHCFPTVEMLPFSAFPMFKNLVDLFDPATRKWMWLSEKPHATGTLKNYCFPMCRKQRIEVDELDSLPFKYLLFGHNGNKEETLYANFEVTSEMRAVLAKIQAEGASGARAFARDPEGARRLLSHLHAAQEIFDRQERASYVPPALPDWAVERLMGA